MESFQRLHTLGSSGNLAVLYNKDIDYVRKIMNKHSITEEMLSEMPLMRKPYDGFDAFYSDLTIIVNNEPSLTKQEFTHDNDPNMILERYAKGLDVNMNPDPLYGDFTTFPESYQEALNLVINVESNFLNLPAKIRARFNNEPSEYLAFMSDERNKDEALRLGLAKDLSTPPASNSEGGAGEVAPKT